MNYIQLIRNFWTSNELNSFRTSEIALFFYLAEINNRLSWSESFKRNNQRVMFDLSISFNTLKDARNRLKQAGLIDFQTQNGSPNVVYKILTLSNFDEVTDEVTNEVSTRLLSRLLTSKNKQETKQNKNSSSSNNINTTKARRRRLLLILKLKKFIRFGTTIVRTCRLFCSEPKRARPPFVVRCSVTRPTKFAPVCWLPTSRQRSMAHATSGRSKLTGVWLTSIRCAKMLQRLHPTKRRL